MSSPVSIPQKAANHKSTSWSSAGNNAGNSSHTNTTTSAAASNVSMNTGKEKGVRKANVNGSRQTHSRSYPRGVGLDFRKLAGITLINYIDHHGTCCALRTTGIQI
jgi:hypothetical protein